MSKPRLLDLFSGAGGAARGYQEAGFYVVGVDIEPQPNYCGDEFWQDDALDILERWRGFDAVHASPPCQGYTQLASVNAKLGREQRHAKLIEPTRELLEQTGLPYVIENVVGAPLIDPVRICGTSFGLPLRRHRLFESNFPLEGRPCEHHRFTEPRYWTSWRPNGEHRLSTVVQVYGNAADKHEWPAAMGIDWMTNDELAEAIPPAYTRFIGEQLMPHLALTEKAEATS
jgi:DNA (cytosine-5)-methyltransferase 1